MQFGKANTHSFWLFVLFYRLPHRAKLRLMQVNLSLGSFNMAERNQVTQSMSLPGRTAKQETLRQTCWVLLQGCGSLLSSTLLPAEITAPVTQIHTKECAALKPKTHHGAVRDWNYNAELGAEQRTRSAFNHSRGSKNQPRCPEQTGTTAL